MENSVDNLYVEILIDFVKDEPYIYNKRHEFYKNTDLKKSAFEKMNNLFNGLFLKDFDGINANLYILNT